MSQSPQTGQFNSYIDLDNKKEEVLDLRSQSPQTGQFNSYIQPADRDRLPPPMSQSPQTGQFNSYAQCFWFVTGNVPLVSIPSNGSIQFLQ